jgi:hypothetical protein
MEPNAPNRIEQWTRKNPWVWIAAKIPEESQQILGLHDQEKDIWFIPVFLTKEEALQGLLNLPREKGVKYEVQAIHSDDLVKQSAENGFMLYILNADSEIIEKLQVN